MIGYWQSECYFAEIKEQIRHEMSLLTQDELDSLYDPKSRYDELYEQYGMELADDCFHDMVERDYTPEALQEALRDPNKW